MSHLSNASSTASPPPSNLPGTSSSVPTPSPKIVAGYSLVSKLGAGSFATVYLGRQTTDPTVPPHVAIKAIAVSRLTAKVRLNLDGEISILKNFQHPCIAALLSLVKTPNHVYLVLEFCGGGDLQRLIRSRKSGRLSERLARRLMRDLADGLQFLNENNLIHRDIKPQNLLLTAPLPMDEINDPLKDASSSTSCSYDESTTLVPPSVPFMLKIADFGFARHLESASLAETLCGSPLYMAPEILQHQRYDCKADLWSVGAVLFECIAGRPPFNGVNHVDLLRNIQRKAVRLPQGVRVSGECVGLLRGLLNREPARRMGFNEFYGGVEKFVALGCGGGERRGGMGAADERNPDGSEVTATTVSNPTVVATPELRPMASPVGVFAELAPAESPVGVFAPAPEQGVVGRGGQRFQSLAPSPPDPFRREFPRTVSRDNMRVLELAGGSGGGSEDDFVMIPTNGGGGKVGGGRGQMLSTSPGTGGALMAMMGEQQQFKVQQQAGSLGGVGMAAKMLAAAEDIGRRGVNVAHVGDMKAYSAMRFVNSSDAVPSPPPADSCPPPPSEISAPPSATNSASTSTSTITANSSEKSTHTGPPSVAELPQLSPLLEPLATPTSAPPPAVESASSLTSQIQAYTHLKEALALYVYALKLMKGAVSAAQRVMVVVRATIQQNQQGVMDSHQALLGRCEVSQKWLSAQFNGILDRAEAGNKQVTQLEMIVPATTRQSDVESAQELVYNFVMRCGREGATKQLLSQFAEAKACYKSGGLLTEALLMEELSEADCSVLTNFRDSFVEKVREVDAAARESNKDLGASAAAAAAAEGGPGRPSM